MRVKPFIKLPYLILVLMAIVLNGPAKHLKLRTGEYILVKETLHGQWRGGVIRWIKQSTEKVWNWV